MVEITNREDYDALLKRGIDCLYDKRYHLEIGLRREIQREKFGKNNDAGNALFYAYCIKHFPHVCENCGKPIPRPWATNVSHILTRGSHPEMAHDPRNVNILCWECHDAWEHTTTRHKLNPWLVEKNMRTIQLLKREYKMTELTLNEYQQKAMTTCMPTCENASYMLLNLVGEVGEFASKVAKHIRKGEAGIGSGETPNQLFFTAKANFITDRVALRKEAGDILWQLAGLCNVMGWDLEVVAQENLEKLAERAKNGTIAGDGDGVTKEERHA